jgi:hypothetical protein
MQLLKIVKEKILTPIMFFTYHKQKQGVMAKEPRKSTPSGPHMYVELNSEQPQDNSLGLLETMCNIKKELQSIKEDNEKLLKASKEHEELNEILLKNITEIKQNKNVG